MNWTRGFLRAWAAFSALWIGLITLISLLDASIRNDFKKAIWMPSEISTVVSIGNERHEVVIPIDLPRETIRSALDKAFVEKAPNEMARLWAQDAVMQAELDLLAKKKAVQGVGLPDGVILMLAAGLGVPLAVLLAGMLIRWVLLGFRAPK